jgi:DNA invertase Pin-like site-specific DNA recombinase
MKPTRVVIYARVSTGEQSCESQLHALRLVAERHGWQIVQEFTDEGFSGAIGREKRPAYDALLKGIAKREFDKVLIWSLDRLARSMTELLKTLGELKAKGVGLYIDQLAIDTATPAGELLFNIAGAMAQFERQLIQSRVNAGLARAKAKGVRLGRKPVGDAKLIAAVKRLRAKGLGIVKIGKEVGIGTSTVQRILREAERPST